MYLILKAVSGDPQYVRGTASFIKGGFFKHVLDPRTDTAGSADQYMDE